MRDLEVNPQESLHSPAKSGSGSRGLMSSNE